jgi:anti-sigma-K factor RskA
VNHDSVTREGQETAALYALGALSQHEAREFDAHLQEGCAACYTELEQFEHVVGLLGTVAEPAAPPGYLRELLAVRIEKETAEAPAAPVIHFPEKPAPIAETYGAPVPAARASVVLPWAAAAVLLLGLAYIFTSWQSERQSLRAALEQEKARAAEAAGQTNDLRDELGRNSALTYELAQINSVLTSPRWRLIPLTGQPAAPNSIAKVYWDVQDSRWVVTAELPPAPEGKVYQLWCVTPTAKISAGLIKPDRSGHGFSVLSFPSSAAPLAAAAITLEPEGGSEQPTMPLYALGKAG